MNSKKLASAFSLIALFGAACDTPSFISWNDVRPPLNDGYCEYSEMDFKNFNKANEALTLAKNAFNTGYKPSGSNALYVYEVHDGKVVAYQIEDRGVVKDRYAVWIEYDCDGAELKTFVSAPVPIANAKQADDDLRATLRSGGYVVVKVDREDIGTDEGVYVILTAYYYLPNSSNQAQSIAVSALDPASRLMPEKSMADTIQTGRRWSAVFNSGAETQRMLHKAEMLARMIKARAVAKGEAFKQAFNRNRRAALEDIRATGGNRSYLRAIRAERERDGRRR